MKKLLNFFLNDQASFFALLTLLFLIPFDNFVVSPMIVILSIITLINGEKKVWVVNFRAHKNYYLPMLALYTLHVIGVFWSINLEDGTQDLVQKLSFLIFPLIIPFLNLDQKKVLIIFKTFILSNVIVVLICLANTVWRLHIYEDPQHYKAFGTYHSVFTHRSYYAMHLCIALLFLVYVIKNSNLFDQNKYIVILIFSLLVLGIILSLSKAGLIILFMLLAIYAFEIIQKRLKIWNILMILFGVLIIMVSLGRNITERFSDIYYAFNQPYQLNKKQGFSSSQLRLMLWESSAEAIKEEPVLGYGTGSVKEILRRINKEKGFYPLVYYKSKTNAHNQFLESFISLGFLGVLITLLLFLLPIIEAIKKRNFFQIVFFQIIFINCLWESMFERQSGIIMISLLICILSFQKKTLIIQQ